MSNQTYFQIQRGSVVSDCMPETYDFISQNLEYFHRALKPIRDILSDDGPITFISHETQWSFAVCIEKAELGKVALGKGVIAEGNTSMYDELLEKIS
ncbi:MAG: hypothetical protein ACSHX0_03410 [Akkermansiaceae bacterium]